MQMYRKISILVVLVLSFSGSINSYAEGHANSAVRWVIDSNGVAYKNKFDSFNGWRAQALPYNQKTIAVTGSYFHYRPFGNGQPGYAYDEYSSFAIGEWGNAFRDSDNGWQPVSGCWDARDISSHTINHAYCVNGDGSLIKYNPNSNRFEGYSTIHNEKISRIDVDEVGSVWAITDSHKIFRLKNDAWSEVEFACENNCWPQNIAVGAGKVYVVSQHQAGSGPGSTDLFTLENGKLVLYGAYLEVDIDRDNNFWGITTWDLRLLYQSPGMKEAQPYYSFPQLLIPAAVGS